MKTFAELESQNLTWVKSKRRHLFGPTHFELVDETGDVLATLTRKGGRFSAIEVDAPGNRWRIERRKYLFKRGFVSIQSIGTGEEPAVFVPKGFEGTLTYSDGRVFHWRKHTRLLKPAQWVWTTEDGDPILGIELRTTGWKTKGEISIDPDLAPDKIGIKAPPLLLFLGWYMILLEQDAMAAASVAMIAAGA